MTAGELLVKIMPRLTGPPAMPYIDALQATSEVMANHLWEQKSDLLRDDFEKEYDAEEPTMSLSDGFLGIFTDPWIDGKTSTLQPLPPGIKHTFTESGEPEYYEIRGTKLTLYPTPVEAGTLKGEFFIRPDEITLLTDDLPYDGFFDRAFLEAVLRISVAGAGIIIDPAFDAYIKEAVGSLSHRRLKKNINWYYPL